MGLSEVNDVVLFVAVGIEEYDAVGIEVEGDARLRIVLQGVPKGRGVAIMTDTLDDEHSMGRHLVCDGSRFTLMVDADEDEVCCRCRHLSCRRYGSEDVSAFRGQRTYETDGSGVGIVRKTE